MTTQIGSAAAGDDDMQIPAVTALPDDVAKLAAEAFLEVAWERGYNLQVPFKDKPHILAMHLYGADAPEMLYADFSNNELLFSRHGELARKQVQYSRFIPTLLELLKEFGISRQPV